MPHQERTADAGQRRRLGERFCLDNWNTREYAPAHARLQARRLQLAFGLNEHIAAAVAEIAFRTEARR